MLEGKTNAEKIYRYLYNLYQNPYGVCGLMSAIHDNGSLDSTSVDSDYKEKLKQQVNVFCTDRSYTEAVDNGTISREMFLDATFGYGIMRWSSIDAKAALYDNAKAKNVSIGDLESQLEYLTKDIEKRFNTVISSLTKARNVKTASDAILIKYEGNTSASEELKNQRFEYGKAYFDMFADLIEPPYPDLDGDGEPDAPEVIYEVMDKVFVTGPLYEFGDGSGYSLDRDRSLMHVVSVVDSKRYPYYIGLSDIKDGPRAGWTSPEYLTKLDKAIVSVVEPESKSDEVKGDYLARLNVYIRDGAGQEHTPLAAIREGNILTCKNGEYTTVNDENWIIVQAVIDNIFFKGYCLARNLIKL